jgi:hypothetical protein
MQPDRAAGLILEVLILEMRELLQATPFLIVHGLNSSLNSSLNA